MAHVVCDLWFIWFNTTMGGERTYKILTTIIKQHWFVDQKAVVSIYKFSYLD